MRKKCIIFISLILLVSLLLCGCTDESGETSPASGDMQIPGDYLTYTDEAGIFSVSYPPEWELLLHLLDTSEQDEKDIINSIKENKPVEKTNTVFLAGLSVQTGYSPTVAIVIEPLNDDTWGIDEVCEFEITGIKMSEREYNEISRDKTVIDGKDAIILHYEVKTQNSVMLYTMHMLTTVDKNIWAVVCGASSDSDYYVWEDDFNNIVRSLRILK